jgi:hypothetical protein
VNQHVKDITVVVSKYRPRRQLAAGGFQVSPSGIGVNIDTTVIPAETLHNGAINLHGS